MTRKTLYIHSGRPKTASTYLQKAIFPNLSGVLYRDKPTTSILRMRLWQGAPNAIFMRSPRIWDDLGDQLFQELVGYPRSCIDEKRSVLISDEGIGGCIGINPGENFYWRHAFALGGHLSKLTERAYEWGFDRIKLLLLFRRQDQAVASGYAQISDRRTNPSQSDFDSVIDWLVDPASGFYEGGSALKYDESYSQCVEVLGSENVTFLPYELLQYDRSIFFDRLSEFFDVSSFGTADISQSSEQNVRAAEPGVWAVRSKNDGRAPARLVELLPDALAWRVNFWWRSLSSVRGQQQFRLSGKQSSSVLKAFEMSNRRLAQAIGFDLADYGYYSELSL